VNIYTDSKYVFTTLHVHGAICKERRLLTAEGEKRLKTKKKSSNCWKQSENCLRWLLSPDEATKGV
jgi:ribonuclease HI